MTEPPAWDAPVLVGERVTLRQLDARDADAVWEMVNDDEGNNLTATVATFTREQVDEWCRSRPERKDRLDLAIVDNTTDEFVGEAVLSDFEPERESCNFRISLRGPAWYGRGLGTEATRLIIDHGLDAIGLSAITLEVLARNPRARSVYAKVGFVVVRQFDDDGDAWIEMSITRATRDSAHSRARIR